MGSRGEVFSARVRSKNDRRTYFFNVKENRNRDLFLTIVESKKQEGVEEFDRHQVVVFEDDLSSFARGLEETLAFIRSQRRGSSAGESGRGRGGATPRGAER